MVAIGRCGAARGQFRTDTTHKLPERRSAHAWPSSLFAHTHECWWSQREQHVLATGVVPQTSRMVTAGFRRAHHAAPRYRLCLAGARAHGCSQRRHILCGRSHQFGMTVCLVAPNTEGALAHTDVATGALGMPP